MDSGQIEFRANELACVHNYDYKARFLLSLSGRRQQISFIARVGKVKAYTQ
jgi:hypothetical protein